MKLPGHLRAAPERRGAALLLSFLVLIVIIAIVSQLDIMTKTDARVGFNDISLTKMDLAIESAMLEVFEGLKDDADAGAAAGEAGPGGEEDPGGGLGADPAAAGPEGAPGGESQEAVDSRMDDWARPQGTAIGDLQLRILVQDEDSKLNVLSMLAQDEEEAEKAYQRVAKIIDGYREGTGEDIDSAQAEEMARAMRDHMAERGRSFLPRTSLLTDDEEHAELGMPLTLREFTVLEPFEERHFRDTFDEDGERVHSLGSFLTVWSSPFVGAQETGERPIGEGGVAVNLNTSPAAVLKALMDPRQVDNRIWDRIIEYRNEEEEAEDDQDEDVIPVLDEFGEEILPLKFFDNLEELGEIAGWEDLEPEAKEEVENLLTVTSSVFSVYITARRDTSATAMQQMDFASRAEREQYERSGTSLTRTVRAVVWRREGDDGSELLPLVRWEVLDYMPLEVLDLPDDW